MNNQSDLMEAVRRLEDHEAIRRLVHEYGLALDDNDFERLETLFADDAAMLSPDGLAEGRQQVIDVFRRRLAEYSMTYHVAHTHGIDLRGSDLATGVVTGSAQLGIRGRTYLVALRYHDDYRKEDGLWLFVTRRQQVFYVLPFDEMAHGLANDKPIRWPGRPPRATDVVRQG